MNSFELVLRHAAIDDTKVLVDIALSGNRIAALGQVAGEGSAEIDLAGRVVLPGFVESHIHLDKACILDRCGHVHGGLKNAIQMVSEMKTKFTVDDIYARGARVIEAAITQGTTHMRAHTELDPRIGLRGFEAIRALKKDYAWALDLSICVFPQEGMTQVPEVENLLLAALDQGADVLGGCPYTDTDPTLQIDRIFSFARHFDVDLDFHLDFDLDPSWDHLGEVCRQTIATGYQGRVAVGHVTKLSMLPPQELASAAWMLGDAGIAVTVLPSTDLYLMGRDHSFAVPRGLTPAHLLLEHGVPCAIASNNLLNPFTPFGDASLLRMANLYANVAQVGPEGFARCLDMITVLPAQMMKLKDYGLAVGCKADLVVLDAATPSEALAAISPALMGFKNGRQTFSRKPAEIHFPLK